MDPVHVEEVASPTVDEPVLIEGLPGVGLVGKVAVDHLVSELESRPIRRIYSEFFPPAVTVDTEGIATLASMTLHHAETPAHDLLVLGGATQADDSVGQYRVAEAVLDLAVEFGVDSVITLGGLGTGEQVEEYRVVGAVGGPDAETRRAALEDAGVTFERESPGSIVGLSGLLVGLGSLRGIEATGLLGTTSGFHMDPASARAVVEVLEAYLEFEVDLETLAEQAEQVREVLDQIQKVQHGERGVGSGGEDLRYFG